MIRASIADVSPGRVFGEPLEGVSHPEEAQVFFATARLNVLQLIQGEVVEDPDGFAILELMLPEKDSMAALIDNQPGEEAIFFLRNKGLDAAAQGRSKDIQARDGIYYRRVTDYAVIRNLGGKAHVLATEDADFIGELEGRPFEEVAEQLSPNPEP